MVNSALAEVVDGSSSEIVLAVCGAVGWKCARPFRVRQREIKEQEARDAVAAAEGPDGTGEAWRKESAAEYQAVRPNAPARQASSTSGPAAQPRVFVPQRRAKLVLLEKIDRGEVKGDSVRKYTAEEASEVLDDQLAHSQKHTAMAYRGGRAL